MRIPLDEKHFKLQFSRAFSFCFEWKIHKENKIHIKTATRRFFHNLARTTWFLGTSGSLIHKFCDTFVTDCPIFTNLPSFLARLPQSLGKLSILSRGKMKMKKIFPIEVAREKFSRESFPELTQPEISRRTENSLREILPANSCVRSHFGADDSALCLFWLFPITPQVFLSGNNATCWKNCSKVFPLNVHHSSFNESFSMCYSTLTESLNFSHKRRAQFINKLRIKDGLSDASCTRRHHVSCSSRDNT